ncbi:unnamed protein product, partial [Mesorhabditis belari]|uniref:Uncharacterized protein n=1 Tax=Mesorhabditis belari TaxID=2138241 RepID=A0AAF3EFH2_9BILA
MGELLGILCGISIISFIEFAVLASNICTLFVKRRLYRVVDGHWLFTLLNGARLWGCSFEVSSRQDRTAES